jgi:hypothetical protein
MKFEKIAFIPTPIGYKDWIVSHSACPTPIIIKDKVRVLCGFYDNKGISRIGYIDIDINKPNNIIRVSDKPYLDIGRPGTFDDNGVLPSCILNSDGKYYLYYCGFQLVDKIRYLIFSSIAINGVRVSESPAFNRDRNSIFVKSAPFVILGKDRYMMDYYYISSNEIIDINGKLTPKYNIRKANMLSPDYPDDESVLSINFKDDSEFGIGKPCAIEYKDKTHLFYCTRSINKGYSLGYAISGNYGHFTRHDDEIEKSISRDNFDSEEQAFPYVIKIGLEYYMFYNGNNFGKDGIGIARITDWK